MSQLWVRLDTSFPQNPKVLALVSAKKWQAIVVYTASLAYCGAQKTGGFIPQDALKFIHGTPATARTLVEHRLWEVMPTGWGIPDFGEYQPDTSNISEVRRNAANARWSKDRKAKGKDGDEGESASR